MSLKIKFVKVFDIPVAPDAISQGTTNLASVPVITGDLVTDVSLGLRTYTFNLRGISQEKGEEIAEACNANTEALALGQIDLSQPTGVGQFTYNGINCLPFSYQDGGIVQVGDSSSNYQSFEVTCLTDATTASI